MIVCVRDALSLLDWKRRVFELYAAVRASDDASNAWRRWRDTRDELFRSHPQSPLPSEARASFAGLPYFDYDPSFCVLADVEDAEPERREIAASGDETIAFVRMGVSCSSSATPCSARALLARGLRRRALPPVRRRHARARVYGAGRYLLDTVKGADLGADDGRLVLDFNFAYNPSCSYDPRWVCPLAPPPNRLDIAVLAGERTDPNASGHA